MIIPFSQQVIFSRTGIQGHLLIRLTKETSEFIYLSCIIVYNVFNM